MSDGPDETHPEGKGFKKGSRERALFDPSGTAIVSTVWRPNPKQERVLVPDVGIDLIVGGLGSGKSDVGALKLLRWALRYPRRKDGSPTKFLILGPDFSLLREEQMQKILDHAARLQELGYASIVKRVCYGQHPSIYLCHDQELLCRSGTEPKRMRGHQFEGMWMDEAEFQQERAFTLALSRMRSAPAIRAVATTSPQTVRNSWIWPLLSGTHDGYNKLRERTPVRVHRWRSTDNTANDPEVLGAISAALEAGSPGTAAQELDGLFLGTHEAPDLGAFDYSKAFVTRISLGANEARAAVLGVDLGKQQDFTWLTILSQTGVVLFMQRFNASTVNAPRDAFYPWVERRIVTLVEQWRIPLVKIDTAMQGASFSETLRRALGSKARVEGYGTDAPKRKAQAIEALGVALSRRAVQIPDVWVGPDGEEHKVDFVLQLKRELSELQVDERDGYRTFNHPPGAHDDGIVSVALAAHGLAVGRPAGGDLTRLRELNARFMNRGRFNR
jgi:hypothetical protein